MDVSDFDFDLPSRLIAQEPPAIRGTSRLLVLRRASGRTDHVEISRLPELLTPGDLLVVNDTRVFPARLLGKRVPSGGGVECFLLSRIDEDTWDALVNPGQKLQAGARMEFGAGERRIAGEVLERHAHGRRTIRLRASGYPTLDAALDAVGHIPLPPYIKRADGQMDQERYQTVYARARGSVAAPTAGLHFTPDLLNALSVRGVERASVTLHVGYGTFQPVRVETVEAHVVEPERFSITPATAEAVNRARREGRRVVAVGTTTTRALESAARGRDGLVAVQEGRADLFIYPGFAFQIVSALLTNFHLPSSSLLMLAAAFGGREAVLAAYRDAVTRDYRFYSYGDAMLIL